jgi:hypothetical protein
VVVKAPGIQVSRQLADVSSTLRTKEEEIGGGPWRPGFTERFTMGRGTSTTSMAFLLKSSAEQENTE